MYYKNAIIFALETLIDIYALENSIINKDWEYFTSNLQKTYVYPGVENVINHYSIYAKISIVTNYPREIVQKLLNFHKLNIPIACAYEDSNKHKPFPDPLIFAIKQMDIDPNKYSVITMCSDIDDIKASISTNNHFNLNPDYHGYQDCYIDCGITPMGVIWGKNDSNQLTKSGAKEILYVFETLLDVFGGGYGWCFFPPLLSSNKLNIPFIDNNWSIVSYFPKKSGNHDVCSRSIVEFKKGNYKFVKKWSQLIDDIFINGKPNFDHEIIRHNSIYIESSGKSEKFPKIDAIIRVLGHDETIATGFKPIDEICDILSNKMHAKILKGFLSKAKPIRQLKYLNKEERKNEIKNIYNCNTDNIPKTSVDNLRNILIVDDILTTGLTVSSIGKAIKTILPFSKIFVITLGRTMNTVEKNSTELVELFTVNT
jgi:hypothetical protein